MGNLGGVATNSMNAVPAPTLLIADDDPQLRTALAEVFEGQGYLVRTAATGEESLELIDRDPVDCLLIDFNLPGLTGLETIRARPSAADLSGVDPHHRTADAEGASVGIAA